MEIRRERYLDRLIAHKHNGRIKVVTGLRRSGKTFVLFELFRSHLIEQGVPPEHIIQ
ncbi:MAG: AAA family ATPase, partial [Pyramidobacter sp.]|nr:AAA family ATPase [Pyramidobacter sp.]